jgi:hypothetical protein
MFHFCVLSNSGRGRGGGRGRGREEPILPTYEALETARMLLLWSWGEGNLKP